MKKIFLSILVVIIVIGITGCRNNGNIKDEKKVILNDSLSFEINDEVKLFSIINEQNEVEIVSEDELIDTSTLGQKEITIKYKDNDEVKDQIVNITIVDTQNPKIEYKKELSTTEGTKIDLLKDVKVDDNSKEKIKATVEGEYDFNKVGIYNLKYIAIDSSNNKTSEKFTLNVKKKPTLTIGMTYEWKDNTGGGRFTLNKDGSIKASAWATNGGGTTYRGTYKIQYDKLIISLNKYEDVDGSWRILPKEEQKAKTFTIIDNDTFKDDINGNVYKRK